VISDSFGRAWRLGQAEVAIVRGLGHFVGTEDGPGAAALRRPPDEDLFR